MKNVLYNEYYQVIRNGTMVIQYIDIQKDIDRLYTEVEKNLIEFKEVKCE